MASREGRKRALDTERKEYICILDEAELKWDKLCNYLSALDSCFVGAAGGHINGKSYVKLEVLSGTDLKTMQTILSEYKDSASEIGSVEVVEVGNSASQSFDVAMATGCVVYWNSSSQSCKSAQASPELTTLNRLESFLNGSGTWDSTSFMSSSPTPKSKLIYSELRAENAAKFCFDAVDTIAGNLIFSLSKADSPFRCENIKVIISQLRSICARKDLASAIGLALLVHASKSKNCLHLLKLSERLAASSLSIVAEAPQVHNDASKLLDEPHIKRILLNGTSLCESALSDLSTVYVDFGNTDIRGWCAPGMAVINVTALQDSCHLEHPAAMAALIGHEMRHAVVRKSCGNDMNFSSPTKTELTKHPKISQSEGNRESGLCFELEAIGEKFTYYKNEPQSAHLLQAILTGWKAGRTPAVDEDQILRFKGLRASHNSEVAFEYAAREIID